MKKRLLLQLFLLIVSMGLFANNNGTSVNYEQEEPLLTLDATSTYFNEDGEGWNFHGRAEWVTNEVTVEVNGEDPDAFIITKTSIWGNGDEFHKEYWFYVRFAANDGTRVYRATITLKSEGIESASLDVTGVVTSASVDYVNFGEVGIGSTSNVIKIKTLGGIFGNEQCYSFYSSDSEDVEAFTIVERKVDYETYEGEVTIVFNPQKVKAYSVKMEVSFMNRGKVSIRLVGYGVEPYGDTPYISLSHNSLDFPDRKRMETTMQNIWVGRYNLTDEISYELSGEGASVYSVNVIEDDGSYNLYEVSFTPEEVLVPYNAILTFSSSGAEDREVELSGSAVPIIELSDQWLDFGDVAINKNETKELALTVTGIDLIDDITYYFAYDDDLFTVDERDWDPSAGGTLYITFTPKYLGYASGNRIEFHTYGAYNYIYLSGEGIEVPGYPILTFDPHRLDIINPYLNTESEPQLITVTGTDLSGDISYSLSDTEYANDFTVNEVSWNPLTGGTLTVIYTPVNNNSNNASIPMSYVYLVFEGGGAVSKYVTLFGTALSIMADEENVDFGNVQIGKTKSKTVILSGVNPELNEQIDISYLYDDDDYFDFNILSFDPDTYLSTVEITFTPGEQRSYRSEFSAYAPGNSCYISLRGNGVSYDPVSIDTVDKDAQGLLIYPNPASEQITVKTGEENIGKTIGLYTINGVLLSNSTIKGITTQVDVSSLPKGIYLIRVGEEYGKVVKQ